MIEVFIKIVNMSISASWLILAVIAVKLLFKRAPKWLATVLWCIVGIRLLLPFPAESALSLIPSADTINSQIMYADNPTIHTGINEINSSINPIISKAFAPDPSDSANPLQIWIPIAAIIWIAGSLILLSYAVFSYVRLKRRLAAAVRLRENIYQSENVVSPFVFGILRPRIYLPFHISDANIAMVIAHERAHIKRHDHWMKFIGFLLLSIHWFNPLLWIAYALLDPDIEFACDEYVVQDLDEEERADYSETLLALSIPKRMIAACPLASCAGSVKRRVKNVLNYKKPAFIIVVMAVIICFIAAVCFLTNPQESAAKQDTTALTQENAAKQNPFSQIPDTSPSMGSYEKIMTLEDVFLLSQKGKNLTYDDLSGFKCINIGSGLIVLAYEIDDTFFLMVGDQNRDYTVGYAELYHFSPNRTQYPFTWGDEFIDIKSCDTETLEKFIRKYQEDDSADNTIAYRSRFCAIEDADGEVFDKMLELATNTDSAVRLPHSVMNLPIVKIESKAELDSYCAFAKQKTETASFAEAMENYTEKFFKKNSLFIIYAYSDSSDYLRCPDIEYVRRYSDTLSVSVVCSQRTDPDTGWFIPLDLNTSWLIIVEAASEDVTNVTQADAWLSPLYD